MDPKILKHLEEINKKLETVTKNFATKDDLKVLKKELRNEIIEEITEAIKNSEAFIINSVGKYAAAKSTVDDLEKRVTKLEKSAKIN